MDFLKNIGLARLGTIIGVTIGVLLGLLLIIFQLATPPMSLLYSGLDFEEAGEIMQRLDQFDVPYEVDGNGTMIFAPKDQVSKLRMDLASEGLPTGGTVGYEIFDNGNALNTTSFVQDLNKLRGLEGELARSIKEINVIDNARVHLVIPERSLFSKDKQQPTASIMIDTRGQLSRQNVQAIQNLVAAAVPGLAPSRISVIDETGRLLAAISEQDEDAAYSLSLEDRTQGFEDRMVTHVRDIVSSVVGPDNVRVRVSAELDFNRIVEHSEIYDPDGQVARSTKTVEETSNDTERNPDGTVSVTNNLPEEEFNTDSATASSNNNRLEETVNFEISRTTKTETQEAGRINRLSVAVVVDGSYTQNEDGTQTYVPRTDAEMTRITSLVRSAIGYDQNRGDTLEVLNLQFAQTPQPEFEETEEPFLGLTKDDYFRIGEIAGAVVVAVILMLVLKTALGRASAPAQAIAAGATPALAAAGEAPQALPAAEGMEGGQLALPPGATPDQLPEGIPGPQMTESALSKIDVAQIHGQVQESSIKKVGELVNSHPEESIAILRSWLHGA